MAVFGKYKKSSLKNLGKMCRRSRNYLTNLTPTSLDVFQAISGKIEDEFDIQTKLKKVLTLLVTLLLFAVVRKLNVVMAWYNYLIWDILLCLYNYFGLLNLFD